MQTFGASFSPGVVAAGLTDKGGSAALDESLLSCLEGGSSGQTGPV